MHVIPEIQVYFPSFLFVYLNSNPSIILSAMVPLWCHASAKTGHTAREPDAHGKNGNASGLIPWHMSWSLTTHFTAALIYFKYMVIWDVIWSESWAKINHDTIMQCWSIKWIWETRAAYLDTIIRSVVRIQTDPKSIRLKWIQKGFCFF